MDQFDILRPQDGRDETIGLRRLDVARVLTLGGAMMLAGAFWWFLGRILLGV